MTQVAVDWKKKEKKNPQHCNPPICAQMLSRLWLFMTPWTVASQDTLQLKLSDKNQKKVKKKVLILFTSGHGDLGWTGATPWSLGRPGSPVFSVGG